MCYSDSIQCIYFLNVLHGVLSSCEAPEAIYILTIMIMIILVITYLIII